MVRLRPSFGNCEEQLTSTDCRPTVGRQVTNSLPTAITDSDGLTLKRRRSSRHPAVVLPDLDYADDIALLENTIKSAQDLLNRVEKACQDVGLFLNAPKTKYMHLNPLTNTTLVSSDGSPIELVQDFKYLGGYTDSGYDMNTRIGQAWSALNSLDKVWKATIKKDTKLKVFKASVETILLYGSDSWTLNVARSQKLDGSYTKMLRTIYNISWRDHVTNKSLYGHLPRICTVVKRRRLALAGHVSRHNEPAGLVLLWSPEVKRRVGSQSKRLDLSMLIDTYKPDIINATETHLNSDISSAELGLQGFEVFRKDRIDNGGGGVLIGVSSDILATEEGSLQRDGLEAVWCRIHITGCKPLYNGCIYRQPSNNSEPIIVLDETLATITSKNSLPNVLLTGDFNLPHINWDTEDHENKFSIQQNPQYGHEVNQAMLDLVNRNSLSQHSNKPTRGTNILDLVLTTNPSLVNDIQVEDGMSDHDIVITDLDLKRRPQKKNPRRIYIYKRADTDSLKKVISDSWNKFLHTEPLQKCVEDNWKYFKDMTTTAMQHHIPTKMLSGRWNIPWLTPALRKMMRKKQRYYNRAKRTLNEHDWKSFKNLRKTFKAKLADAHNKYVLDLLDWPTGDNPPTTSKKFWSYIKSIRNESTGIGTLNSGGIEISDNHQKAELLSDQFKSVFTNEDMSRIPDLVLSSVPDIPPLDFQKQGIINLLRNINVKKANGPDNLPCWVLKEAAEEIAPFLQLIFNQSMNTGQVPDDWKKANITPVFKKGSRTAACNYRPISLTSVPCKIMEHIIFHHMMAHLDTHRILVDFQHGFRKGYSCETQLITIIEKVARNLDRKLQTDMLLLDFSKAFDTVPHHRLLHKIYHYGIRGNLNLWIESWLTERSQTVVTNGACSTPTKVKSGVPQGTVLGPQMFLLYINDIGDQIDGHMGLFADDSALYGVVGSIQDAQSLQHDLDNLNEWAHKWQMSFNADKCSILRIYRCHNPIDYQYKIGGQELTTVQHHPYLGVELTRDLNWNKHISNIVGKANRTLGFMRRNLSNCPEKIKKQAYHALVRPHLEYASSVWDPHVQKQINDIEAVQRRAARFVKRCYDRTPGTVTTILNELEWPTLQQRRKEARLTMMYKTMNGQISMGLPPYLIPKERQTRQYHPKKFISIASNTNTYKNSFIVRTIADWNKLPANVIDQASIETFKAALKAHFIKLE